MQKTVVVFSPLAAALREALGRDFEVIDVGAAGADFPARFAAALPRAHGLIGAGIRLDGERLGTAARLEVIATISAGYDHYDLDYLNRRGIVLTNTPDALTESTADLGFALLLAAARRVVELDRWTRAGRWQRLIDSGLFGAEVHGRRLGIVGPGRIGEALARRGRFGFGMSILYHGRSPKPEWERSFGAQYRELDALLAEADFVCLCVPLGPATRRLIGARELALMQPHAILVNIARGEVVDQAALIAALRERRIGGAGLDVFEREPLTASPLFALDNVVVLPHIGSATAATRQAMAEQAVINLRAALTGGRPPNLVNPGAWKPTA